MVEVNWYMVIANTLVAVLGLLPFTGYWYYSSYIFEGCAERLDVFFALACITILVIVLGMYRAVTTPKHMEPCAMHLAIVILSWCGIGGLQGAHNLQAVISCWLHFKDNEHYSGKHVAVFILYGLFALIYGLILGGFLLFMLCSEDLSPWRIRRKEQSLLQELLHWRSVHVASPSSDTSRDLLQVLIRKINTLFSGVCPPAIQIFMTKLFFEVVMCSVYRPDTSVTPRVINCMLCFTPILPGERYWIPGRQLTMGPIHFDCFQRSRHLDKAINSLNSEIVTKAYADLRTRVNTNTKVVKITSPG